MKKEQVQQFVSAPQLEAEGKKTHKLGKVAIESILKGAQVKPVAEMKLGRGTMRMYDAVAARRALEGHSAEKMRHDKAVAAAALSLAARQKKLAAAAPAAAAPVGGHDEIIEFLAGAQRQLNEAASASAVQHNKVLDAIAEGGTRTIRSVAALDKVLAEEAAQLREGNRALLKAVEHASEDINTLRRDLATLRGDVLHAVRMIQTFVGEADADDQSDNVVSIGDPKTRRLRVAIFNLLASQATMLRQEFGSRLDLRIFDSEKSPEKGAPQAKNCDVALLIVNFVSHGTEQAIRAQGIPIIHVNGGLTSLRTHLEELASNPDKHRREAVAAN